MASKSKLPVAMPATAPSRDMDDIKYRAKDALQTIKRAEEYKSDKDLMKHVKQCAKQERKTLDKIK